MALSRVKTWSNGEVLTHTDLNAEFDNILNNALSLVSPWTSDMNANNNSLTNLEAGTVTAPSIAGNNGTTVGIYFSSTVVSLTKSGNILEYQIYS